MYIRRSILPLIIVIEIRKKIIKKIMIDNINEDRTNVGNEYQEEHFPPYEYHMIYYHINQ